MYGGALEALMCLSNYADAKTLDAQVYIGKYSEQKKKISNVILKRPSLAQLSYLQVFPR